MGSRVICVGDVHGCLTEFEELLARLDPRPDDRVILLGDLLDKGPEPYGCLRLAIDRGFDCVASNHEERHARWWWMERRQQAVDERRYERYWAGDRDALDREGVLNVMRPWHDPRDLETNRRLTEGDVRWIETRPPWISIVPGWIAVHGGLQPGVALAQQDPRKVMRLRWVKADGSHVPADYETPGWTPPEGARHWTEGWTGPEPAR